MGKTIRKTIKQILQENSMAKPKQKITHSKFFPEENQFVNLQGNYWDNDNWEINLTVHGGSRDGFYLWVTDYDKDAAFLKELAITANKALEAIDKFKERAKKEAVEKKPAKITTTKKK